jgi:hypothetical protein
MLSISVFPPSNVAPSHLLAVWPPEEESMHREGDEVHVNETEATGGVKQHGVRYVLGFSLLLVVIAMSLVWALPALFPKLFG